MADFNIADMDLGGASDIDGFMEKDGAGKAHTAHSILSHIDVPMMTEFDMGGFEMTASAGIDGAFAQNPRLSSVGPVATAMRSKQASGRMRVASIRQLAGFDRVSAETLIHRSDRDLWTLKKEADGSYYVERLFDDNGRAITG